jgi:cytochrome c biogenesis factor
MKSPGGCFIALIPTLIALAFLWHNGHLSWLCWVVTGAALFSWLSGEAVVHSRLDAESDPEKRAIYRFWLYLYGPVTILLLLLCVASIIGSFF